MAHDRDNYASFGGGYQFQHDFGGRRTRRPTCDYGSTLLQWMRHRRGYGKHTLMQERSGYAYINQMVPPHGRPGRPADTIPAKCLHSSLNKVKHPINVVKWTPEGRRLLTGSSSGEFTLWNGMQFNFETIMSAHETAIRSVAWSHSRDWLISADHSGIVKYWQPNFNNVKAIQAHEEAVRELAFAPTDVKFVTASDDSTMKIWDFGRGTEELTITGHSWDVKCVDWHPEKGLLVSGSKDHLIKLWDPRNGRCLNSLHGHKNTVHKTKFGGKNGDVLASCGRDNTVRIFDLRMMRDVLLLKGHERDIMTLTWHPIHRDLLSTGGADGALFHYILHEPNPPDGVITTVSPYRSMDPQNAPTQTIWPAHKVPYAHEHAIWTLDWHPLGHILASGSNDRVTRFWTRARPNERDCFVDRYHLGDAAAKAHGAWSSKGSRHHNRDDEEQQEEEDEAEALVEQSMPSKQPVLPGLPGLPGIGPALPPGLISGGSQSVLPGMSNMPPPLSISNTLPPVPNLTSSYGLPGAVPNHAQPPPPLTGPSRPTDLPYTSNITEMYRGGQIPPPPPPPAHIATTNNQFPPPPPGFFKSGLPQPATAPPPQGYNAPMPPYFGYPTGSAPNTSSGDTDYEPSESGPRRRAPLPSQEDSLRNEMRRGNFRR